MWPSSSSFLFDFFYVMWNLYFTILKFCNVIWYFALSCSYLVNSTFYWIAVHSENPRLLTRNSILCCIFLKSCYVLTINIFISVNKVIYIGFKKDVFIFNPSFKYIPPLNSLTCWFLFYKYFNKLPSKNLRLDF